MNTTQKTIALAIGGAFALSIATTTVNAAENPFSAKTLSSGYQVADNHDTKMKDGKCGEGKCGESMKKDAAAKAKDGKCGEGKCGESMKKDAAAKAKDGKCGEGKCSH